METDSPTKSTMSFNIVNLVSSRILSSLGDEEIEVDIHGNLIEEEEAFQSFHEEIDEIEEKELLFSYDDFKEEYAVFKLNLLKDNKFIHRCLDNPIEDGSRSKKIYIRRKDGAIYFPTTDYQRLPDGRLEFIREDIIAKQKGVFLWALKKVGSSILAGKSPFLIPLPVHIFTHRSYLQRIASSLGFVPHYFDRAVQIPHEPIEQLRLIVATFLASLHLNMDQQKPFNPILGETFQGFIDGNPIYIEQISHHPPIHSSQFYGRGYKIEGTFEATGKISTSGIVGIQGGLNRITFESNGNVLYVRYPHFRMEGMAFGKRTINFVSKLVVFDPTNNLIAKVKVDPDQNLSSLFHRDKLSHDSFRGGIYQVSSDFSQAKLAEIKKGDKKLKSKPKHYLKQVSKVEGTWMDRVVIDDITYWKLGMNMPFKVVHAKSPLPSDSTYREDMLLLMKDDIEAANVAKESLENRQRQDKALREAAKPKKK
eukprot:TRINITY_DN4845_c0_g5_i1.p1 TRINITY_DN4845_c0_g5~~TRINITY_DN4845_c0_g5_i1.p1  ORF type:complete len:480 (+),score=102.22 TRINITY_DN4845_c0_g5_i1:74-1513(+)